MNLLYQYCKPYRKLFAAVLLLATTGQVLSLLDPLIIRHVIDQYVLRHRQYTSAEFVRGAGLLLLAAAGVAIVSRVAKSFQDYFSTVAVQRLSAKMYSDGIRHALDLPYCDFEDQRSGETLAQLQRVRSDVERLIIAGINVLFVSIIGVVFVGVYSFRLHWSIAPAVLIAVPGLTVTSGILSRRIRHMQKAIFAESTALAGSTTESLRNIELVKGLGLVDREIERLNGITRKILQLELRKVKYLRRLSFFQGAAVNGVRSGLLFLLMYLIFRQQITVGQMFALMVYSFFVFTPLQSLGNVINIYRECEVSLQNFQEILSRPCDPTPLNLAPVKELMTLQCEQVSFRHRSSATLALESVSFCAERGNTIALVGPSGAGKSTLMKLLLGLYAPEAGQIRYNGIPAARVDMGTLREKIGVVTQDTQLFSGSIRENLSFANPDATDAECLDVLRQAAASSLLARADRGLDTPIGEGGIKVSGGEKQRLAIARALLRRPQLLLFDEATSALDSLTEDAISRTIREVTTRQQAITILIAHRLSTVLHADCIYVLERGRIVESGRHAELLRQQGLYAAMWRLQVGEREMAPAPVCAGGEVNAMAATEAR